jgi:hypothetical protein
MRRTWRTGTWSTRERRILVAVGVVLVAATFLVGTLPAWQRAQLNDRQIDKASSRLASLGDWAAAGVWLEASAQRWQPVQAQRYERRFPREKEREQLFLDLARLAREAGIEPIQLRELPAQDEMEAPLETETADAATGDPVVTELVDRFAPDTGDLPPSGLQSYRLAANFAADYGRLARFLGGVGKLERAVTVRELNAVPQLDQIEVALEMEFYAQKRD